jgi:hypothetical protein
MCIRDFSQRSKHGVLLLGMHIILIVRISSKGKNASRLFWVHACIVSSGKNKGFSVVSCFGGKYFYTEECDIIKKIFIIQFHRSASISPDFFETAATIKS